MRVLADLGQPIGAQAPADADAPRAYRDLRKPDALPEVWSQTDWTTGWLQGLAVGLVNGVALAVLFGWLK